VTPPAPRFEADARIVRPAYAWLAVPAVISALAIAMMARGDVLGMALQLVSTVALGIGVARRPKASRPARIRVDEDGIHADGRRLASLADIVGMAAVSSRGGRLASLTLRGGRTIDLLLAEGVHVAELRTAVGLALARSAATTFRVHAPLGFFSLLATLGASVYGAGWLVAHLPSRWLILAGGVLVPLILVGVPLIVARLKAVTVTCGEEGLNVDSAFGRRVVPFHEIVSIVGLGSATIIGVQTKTLGRVKLELPSIEEAAAFVEHVQQRAGGAGATAPQGDASIAAILARGDRDPREWLNEVRVRASPATEAYRTGQLPEDRLWSVVEDPTADPSARVAAALALRTQASGGTHVADLEHRVRVAAGTTAFPNLRVALEEIASAEDEAQLPERLARVLS
jgi:hypothetical protein